MRRLFKKSKLIFFYFLKLFMVIDYCDLFLNIPNLFKRFLLNWDYLIKEKTPHTFPTHIIIELTNVCNLKCIMCPSPKQNRTKGYISKETFIELIDQIKGKVEIIDFDLYGEILIHPEYDWFIQYAKKNKIKTSVSTNATFLTKEHSQRLINSNLDYLIISIDDVSGGSYDEIRKGASFATIIENTRNFLTLNNRKIFTVIQKIHMSSNVNTTWSYVDEMQILNADIVRLKPYRDLDSEKKYLRTNAVSDLEKIQCPYLWRVPVVTWKGELIPCCNDYNATMSFGSIHQDSVINIWKGERFGEMREKHINKQKESIDLCRGCSAIEFNNVSLVLSSLVDGLNSRKILSVLQTIKILIADFKS